MVINHLLTGMILQELTKIVKSSSIIASCDIFCFFRPDSEDLPADKENRVPT